MADNIPPIATPCRRAFLIRAVPVALGLVMVACAPAGDVLPLQGDTPPAAPVSYRLGSGDRVRVIVYNQPDLTGEYQIDGAGTIAFPLVGAVPVKGSTVAEMETKIADALSPDYLKSPSVSVEVIEYRPFYIVGEVKNPGSYPFVDGMRVINAVALAGGFTYRARESNFYIRRVKESDAPRQEARQDTPVWPGDVIIVRERYF